MKKKIIITILTIVAVIILISFVFKEEIIDQVKRTPPEYGSPVENGN